MHCGGPASMWIFLGRGVVGLHLEYTVLHVTFFHEHDIAGPVFREILYAQDIFEFVTQAAVQGHALCHHILIEVRN
jgi:hypothetical protein